MVTVRDTLTRVLPIGSMPSVCLRSTSSSYSVSRNFRTRTVPYSATRHHGYHSYQKGRRKDSRSHLRRKYHVLRQNIKRKYIDKCGWYVFFSLITDIYDKSTNVHNNRIENNNILFSYLGRIKRFRSFPTADKKGVLANAASSPPPLYAAPECSIT